MGLLAKHKLVQHQSKPYDGYRLTSKGYDFLALKSLAKRGTLTSLGIQVPLLLYGAAPLDPKVIFTPPVGKRLFSGVFLLGVRMRLCAAPPYRLLVLIGSGGICDIGGDGGGVCMPFCDLTACGVATSCRQMSTRTTSPRASVHALAMTTTSAPARAVVTVGIHQQPSILPQFRRSPQPAAPPRSPD